MANRTTEELFEEVVRGFDDEARAEAADVIERLSTAIHDACEVWGTVYVAALLHGLGPKLLEAERP